MAFSRANNQQFHERARALCVSIYDAAFVEGQKLKDIYTHEAGSGNEANFADTGIATEQEATEVINLINALQTTATTHLARLTPFIQG